jgi:aminomethyltransferase
MGKGKSALSLFVDDETGGILDDLIITNTDQDYLYMVTNASCKEQDMKILTEQQVSDQSTTLRAFYYFYEFF